MVSIVCAELCVDSQGMLLLLLPKEASSCSLACSMRALRPDGDLVPRLPLPELRLRCEPCSELLCCRAASVRAAALEDAHMHWLRGEGTAVVDEKMNLLMHLTSQRQIDAWYIPVRSENDMCGLQA